MIIRLTKQSVLAKYTNMPQGTNWLVSQPYKMQKPVVSTVQTADLNTIMKIVVLTQVT